MVRVPGSLGDSGFHRESVEDAQVKKEPGEEASLDIGSTKTLLNKVRSADRQSARRTSVDGIEGDLETDLADKPQHPPQVPSGSPVGLGGIGPIRVRYSLIRLDPGYLDAIADKAQIVSKKLRAPGLDDEDPRPSALDWSEATWIQTIFSIKIQTAIQTLVDKLRPLVDMIADSTDPKVPDPVLPAPVSSPRVESTGYRSSSHYVSAAEHVSDTSSEPQRMSLGPSGSAMLDARSRSQRQELMRSGPRKQKPKSTHRTTSATGSDESNGRLASYFQAAMTRFLKEQQVTVVTPTPVVDDNVGSRDVEISAPAAVATAASGSTGSSLDQCVRISAMSDLKEFSGKDQDEDRARSWISKVKSAFLRDQATDEEKCLTFADLLTGPAKNWYRQLGRSTRNKWSDLLRSFHIQYCGVGVSVAWQYYHSRKRSEESPLEYLYRLNVAALHARLKIKDGDSKARREHGEHFIETLGDPELADQLTLLRLADAEDLEEVLRARKRAKSRQKRSAFGSKYRQKVPTSAPAAATKRAVRAVQIASQESGSDTGSEGSDSEGDLRRVYPASADDKSRNAGCDSTKPDRGNQAQINHDAPRSDPRSRSSPDGSERSNRCSHCGSRKHTDLDCWRRFACEKCGKRGHPANRCLFVCRGCGELHEMGKCPMEEFYNQIRQWFNPAKHAGMLPAIAEKMLNYDAPRVGIRPEEWFEPAGGEVTTEISEHDRDRSLPRVSEHRRSGDVAKITGKINNAKSILLLDTGAEVSIVDTAFAQGRTRIKVTLVGSLVYFFNIWVGDLSGHEAILGMDFMVPAGIRLDLADGSICLPDEVKILLSGRRQLYNDNVRHVCVDQGMQIAIGDSIELPLRMKVTNVSDKDLVLHRNERIGMWLAGDRIPRIPGYVSIGSRRYMEWQNLAFQATTYDRPTNQEAPTGPPVPAVERPIYPAPRAILQRRQVSPIVDQSTGPPDPTSEPEAMSPDPGAAVVDTLRSGGRPWQDDDRVTEESGSSASTVLVGDPPDPRSDPVESVWEPSGSEEECSPKRKQAEPDFQPSPITDQACAPVDDAKPQEDRVGDPDGKPDHVDSGGKAAEKGEIVSPHLPSADQ
ncbi:hypothetical protein PHYSODRAFT_338895, partial [Phytophthora sojae]